MNTTPKQKLKELLAAIHGDGGQYTRDYGLSESCRVAKKRIAYLYSEICDLKRWCSVLSGCMPTDGREGADGI